MDNLSDSQLVVSTLAGNRSAFSILIERYHAMVLHLAYRTIGEHDLAHDLTQETFLHAFLSLSQLRDPQRFRSWLYGITLNVCRDFLRSQHANVLSFESLAGGVHIADDMPSPETIAEQLELRQTVQRALQSLTASNRATVMLFYYEGFNTREIANMLEISVSAVKVRLHKSRQQLKTYLEAVLPIVQHAKGAKNMIPVTIADVHSDMVANADGSEMQFYRVVLFDDQNRRALIIWIGEIEALVIAHGLVRTNPSPLKRPLTQVLLANILKATEATVEAIEISKLENDIYYATIRMKTADGTVREVDARPSDALGIAVWNDIPIFAAESVLQGQGITVPEGKKASRRNVEDWVKNMFTPVTQQKQFTAEEVEQTRQLQREASERTLEKVFE
jgi:RNA polymerase sigma factor (sigma-70 family)